MIVLGGGWADFLCKLTPPTPAKRKNIAPAKGTILRRKDRLPIIIYQGPMLNLGEGEFDCFCQSHCGSCFCFLILGKGQKSVVLAILSSPVKASLKKKKEQGEKLTSASP